MGTPRHSEDADEFRFWMLFLLLRLAHHYSVLSLAHFFARMEAPVINTFVHISIPPNQSMSSVQSNYFRRACQNESHRAKCYRCSSASQRMKQSAPSPQNGLHPLFPHDPD